MIRDQTVLRRASDVRFRAVDDETVVVRQDAAEALVLNEVAGGILELIDGQRTVAEVIDRMQREFEVPASELADDVHSYLKELLEMGIVIEG